MMAALPAPGAGSSDGGPAPSLMGATVTAQASAITVGATTTATAACHFLEIFSPPVAATTAGVRRPAPSPPLRLGARNIRAATTATAAGRPCLATLSTIATATCLRSATQPSLFLSQHRVATTRGVTSATTTVIATSPATPSLRSRSGARVTAHSTSTTGAARGLNPSTTLPPVDTTAGTGSGRCLPARSSTTTGQAATQHLHYLLQGWLEVTRGITQAMKINHERYRSTIAANQTKH